MVLSLKAYVFRALRYLFSVERNRKARNAALRTAVAVPPPACAEACRGVLLSF